VSGPGRAGATRTLVIGLVGPIGCGKSTVAGWLRDAGLEAIDADAVARDVQSPGEPAFDAIVADFGPGILRPDGTLDRAALGRLVFADAAALARLEAIVRPAVRPRIVARIGAARDAGSPGVVLEAIGLVEGGLAAMCDEVWLVECAPEVQRERLAGRGTDPSDAERRIAAQARLVARARSAATRVVTTDGTPAEVRDRVLAAWAEARAHGHPPTG
jgi:dephospho-CoA kinase